MHRERHTLSSLHINILLYSRIFLLFILGTNGMHSDCRCKTSYGTLTEAVHVVTTVV
jgi:hypothetical protein